MAHDCSDIRSSKAPSGISGSRWMTLSASRSRSNSDGSSRPCHLAGPQLPGRLCPELPHSGLWPTCRGDRCHNDQCTLPVGSAFHSALAGPDAKPQVLSVMIAAFEHFIGSPRRSFPPRHRVVCAASPVAKG
jgi:hypothetical protein